LLTPVKYLKGIGEVRARYFMRLGVNTVLDLMEFFPRAYIQRTMNTPIAEFQIGQQVAFTAQISWVDKRLTQKNQPQINIGISDGRSVMLCTWFKFYPGFEDILKPGATAWFNGTVSEYQNMLQLIHPDIEILDEDSELGFWKERPVLPVYPLSGNLTQKIVRAAVLQAFSQYANLLEEILPEDILRKHRFEPRKSALQMMHFTTKPERTDQIRLRFVYEELFFQQLMWARHNLYHQTQVQGIAFMNKKLLTRRLYDRLPFILTQAQKTVLKDIFADMTDPHQMSRLLQGEVGSGKTIVTLFAMLLAIENGYQAVLMAPTEILAEQHYQNISRLLAVDKPAPEPDHTDELYAPSAPPSLLHIIRLVLLKGGYYKGKKEQKEQLACGTAQLIIGTHALLQEDIVFHRLGFVAVDEQHRFGVEQRAALARKASRPDILYLSATPIPRSLAMTVYGDLEVSILDELPPCRKPVQTYVRNEGKLDLVYGEVRSELQKGRQVYIVCPLIEESEKSDLLSAESLYKYISTKVFPTFPSALLHGRMKTADKDAIMHRFKAGELKILVSTTVIEVGVDVPNATVMVVEHAERFGLAQMHQLRGRVGRSADQSFCYLIEHFPISNLGRERLAALTSTTDGFVIAEKDLELRGPGEFFGTEQSGLPRFRFANLMRDQHILKLARNDAFALIHADPELTHPEHKHLADLFRLAFSQREKLIQY